jgi:hypothetical protein
MTWKYEGKTSAFAHLKFDHRSNCALDYGLDPKLFLRGPVCLNHQALVMLGSLNSYDQEQVMKEIYYLIANPTHPSSLRHSRIPFTYLWRTRYPFRNYHYLIRYKRQGNGELVFEEILYDHRLPGNCQPHREGLCAPATQRPMLYHVKSDEYLPYDGPKTDEQLRALAGTWVVPKTQHHQVTTAHAAVNGMQNNFEKAVWLMGVHSQAAYPNDRVREYTLVHNPTDGFVLDVVESCFDKQKSRKPHNAQQLAAVMQQCQQQGRRVKWTVHSQGAIICCAALEELHKRNASIPGQMLAIHGSGANIDRLQNKAKAVGMEIVRMANNPFDLVPNLAGNVDRSLSGLRRSMAFWGLVFGDSIGASPHTLPYLGAETYRTQLQLLGNHDDARKVGRYIDQQIKKGIIT